MDTQGGHHTLPGWVIGIWGSPYLPDFSPQNRVGDGGTPATSPPVGRRPNEESPVGLSVG